MKDHNANWTHWTANAPTTSGLIFPYGDFPGKAVRVVGAYLAIEHINSRNSTVVPEAEMLPPGFKVRDLSSIHQQMSQH